MRVRRQFLPVVSSLLLLTVFAAAAIVQLVEKDKLAYDMPVLQIIPELGDQVAPTLPIAEHYMAVDFETWWNSEESIVAGSADEFIHIAPPATPSAGAAQLILARAARVLDTLVLRRAYKRDSFCILS